MKAITLEQIVNAVPSNWKKCYAIPDRSYNNFEFQTIVFSNVNDLDDALIIEQHEFNRFKLRGGNLRNPYILMNGEILEVLSDLENY